MQSYEKISILREIRTYFEDKSKAFTEFRVALAGAQHLNGGQQFRHGYAHHIAHWLSVSGRLTEC